MNPPGADTVLVRFSGEVGVKSRSVQHRMERQLRQNLKQMLARHDLDVSIEAEHARLYVHTTPEEVDAVAEVTARVFGVTSVSSVREIDPTLDAIRDLLAETAREHYESGTFAVRARRAGNEEDHPFSSTDIEREGGAAVFEAAQASDIEPEVDLDDPDLTFRVECRPERAFVYVGIQSGAGGLPLGTQQPVVALMSGGIDSPVAAWHLMKRGCPVVPVYVNLGRFGGVDHRARAEEITQQLTTYTPDGFTMWVVPGGDGLEQIAEETERYQMLLTRRYMLRIAELIAEQTGAVGIVTGESIGQKSSQTSAAIRVTDAVTDCPVHRPLLTLDKHEITDRAREIGTYEESTIDAGCNRLAPENPATRPPLATVRETEPTNIKRLAASAVEQAEQCNLEAPGDNQLLQ
ncbi:tRNA sulfurtransferase [Halovenus rubra]|uniref:tRNA sulfurtransferase n=2 Tax=Halovenus rubra TaxID=869890 RepID=A0ACC7E7N2_9EURY|nr:tRNA sulfurtransferase [Halovenus rubra]